MAPAIPLIDGHNDVLLELEIAAQRGERRSFVSGTDRGHLDLPRARAGGLAAAFFACFVPESLDEGDDQSNVVQTPAGWEIPYAATLPQRRALEQVLLLLARAYDLERESGGGLRIVRTADDLARCIAGEAIGAILHLEGAEAIDADLRLLQVFHQLGVRSIGLVWSRANAFGTGVPFRFPAHPDIGDGLTAAGLRLVDACNDLRMLIDLSHLNERGFWDVARRSCAPLVASHSAAHALCPSARNLTDDQLRAIAASCGIVGLNLGVGDLRADGDRCRADTPLERVVEHVDHISSLIGVEHVGLGSDLDGAIVPAEVGDAGGLQAVVGALRDHGATEPELHAFAHGNWTRVLADTWAVSSPARCEPAAPPPTALGGRCAQGRLGRRRA